MLGIGEPFAWRAGSDAFLVMSVNGQSWVFLPSSPILSRLRFVCRELGY